MKRLILLFSLVFLSGEIVLSQIINIDGTGKSCTEAKNDALRNAVNKAYGSVIYSKTEINNDRLISDEINMLTSGNILSYEEIKPCVERNGEWHTQLKVIVSKTELAKYIEGKGKSISVSGELIKQKAQQELEADKAELEIIRLLISELSTMAIEPFDYEIKVGQVTIHQGKYCNLPAEVTIKSNLNLQNIFLKLSSELDKITVGTTDQSFRANTLNLKTYNIGINKSNYSLRNSQSLHEIQSFYKKLIEKIDNFVIVDGCLRELYLKEQQKNSEMQVGIHFPDAGFIVKTIKGSFVVTIEEIGSLDRINILLKSKLADYKRGKSLSGDLVLMKYSETNPLEYKLLGSNLTETMEQLAKTKPSGRVNLDFNIAFNSEGKNTSELKIIKLSHNNFEKAITNRIYQTKLNPSKLCGQFTSTSDEISFDFKWTTYNSKYNYSYASNSEYNQFLQSNNLPIGTYTFTIKKKELNGKDFKDIWISDYKIRGPGMAVYSIFLPGWGTRKVTYKEKSGINRSLTVLVPLTLGFLAKATSNSYYNSYLNASEQNIMDDKYNSANFWNKTSTSLFILSGVFYIYDISWVFVKGISNKKRQSEVRKLIRANNLQIQKQSLSYENY
jgi:hypothetical protein